MHVIHDNRYVHSLSPRHVERNYVSRRSIMSRRTRVRIYARRDVDILRHPDSLTNNPPELVSKLVWSIPVKVCEYPLVLPSISTLQYTMINTISLSSYRLMIQSV